MPQINNYAKFKMLSLLPLFNRNYRSIMMQCHVQMASELSSDHWKKFVGRLGSGLLKIKINHETAIEVFLSY